MKAGYIIGIFLILIIGTIACAYAAEATIGDDYKFNLPDGYTMGKHGDDFVFVENKDNHSIRVSQNDILGGNDAMVSRYKSAGFDIKENDTINENGKEIFFVHFIDKGLHAYVYTWNLDDNKTIMAVYGYPEGEPATEWANSPVKEIHDSLVEI